MHHIKELILLLQQQQNAERPHPAKGTNEDPLLNRFLDGILQGTYRSDSDAVADLFPGRTAGHSGFSQLKSTLWAQLKEAILQFNDRLEQHTDSRVVYAECQKQWLNVRFLSGENAAVLALPLAHRLLRIAEKFDFTLLAMDIALYLRIQHCLRDRHGNQCAGADKQYQYWRAVYDAEYQAEKSYTTLMACILDSGPGDETVQRLATGYTAEIQPLLELYPAAKLHLYGYLIGVVQEMAGGDFAAALQQCEKALQFFKNKPYQAATSLQVFYYYHLICCIHLRQVEAGTRSAERCLALCPEDPYNWFKIRELQLMLLLHVGYYGAAAALLYMVTSEPRFGGLPDHVKENWQLFEAYLHLLSGAGELDFPLENSLEPDWYKRRLAAAAPEGNTRLTAALLAADFLMSLQNGQFEELTAKASGIAQFCQTHFQSGRVQRSQLFLHLLTLIPEQGFRRGAILQAAAPSLVKLKAVPLSLSNQTIELEIIPYEILWDIALKFVHRP